MLLSNFRDYGLHQNVSFSDGSLRLAMSKNRQQSVWPVSSDNFRLSEMLGNKALAQ
jgi:hypothetical protein